MTILAKAAKAANRHLHVRWPCLAALILVTALAALAALLARPVLGHTDTGVRGRPSVFGGLTAAIAKSIRRRDRLVLL
jgi:hypothetical protein